MTTIGSISMPTTARPVQETVRLAATVAIRLAGALTVFAGIILTTQALIVSSSLIINRIYMSGMDPVADANFNMGGMTVFSTLGSALVVVVWGALLIALARPLGRFVSRDR